MAIQKRFIHFKKFSDFNSKKLSANEANTQYTVGVSGEIQNGEPDVLYQSYCWIKDTQQQWTHGQLYNGKDTDLATVATSGSYNDLSDKPTIPDALADLTDDASHRTVTDTEKAAWNAKSNFSGSYNDLTNKPTIPSAITVDTALSSYSSHPVQNNVINNALLNKQDKLVSGTNIKTINGESILGNGNMKVVSGGIPVVEVSSSFITLQPNTLTIVTSLAPASQGFDFDYGDDSICNEFMIQFDAISSLGEDSALPSFSFPAGVIWLEEPVFEKNYRYQISIVNNVGIIVGVPLE